VTFCDSAIKIGRVSRAGRLSQIEQLLLAHPEGLLRADIARRLGVHRSTVTRDITELSLTHPIHEEDDRRVRLERRSYLTAISLTMFELEALHLAARLFARVMKFPFPHASAALRKLSAAQGRVSPRLSDWMQETADEIESFPVASAEVTTRYRTIIEQLGESITDSRPVVAHYFSRTNDAVRSYWVLPLTLEPHHEGRAVHVVAWNLPMEDGGFRTLKVERIQSLDLQPPEPDLVLQIPVQDIRDRLSSAWSIWTSDDEAVLVVLLFSPMVAKRVSETLWHSSQQVLHRADGAVVWSGRIAEPREMYPWIRSWGPDVEVLEPQWLQEQHQQDFTAGSMLYKKITTRETDV